MDMLDVSLVKKIRGTFKPDENLLGRMVRREGGSGRATVDVLFEASNRLTIEWGSQAENHISVLNVPASKTDLQAIYISPKEMISASENFVSLYDDYKIAFEETYYDLLRLLERPEKKVIDNYKIVGALNDLEKIIGGKVVQRSKKFYVLNDDGVEIEMGLLSEGYRQIAAIIQLIKSGTLTTNSILFWEEPETNINPKMIRPLVEALLGLASAGVNVYIATHDYFIQQEIQLEAKYNFKDVPMQFISLYEENGLIKAGCSNDAESLAHNPIMEEFDEIYRREQELILSE